MKTTILKLIISGVMLISLSSCETLTFGGKTVVKIKNDVAYQTIRWDVNSSEADVEREFRAFIREILNRYRYKNYVQLFQSNYLLDEGERTYVIKIFQNEEAKNNYLDHADDMIRRTTALANNRFSERWNQLQPGMIVEDVYDLLPELANFKAKQVFYTHRSELQLSDRWLSFDLKGRLLSFGTGKSQTSSPQNEEWVF
ncbi:hypothetical protein [Petrimonas sp.]|uniref:hypothetical protein n=1 Tax=Petrimonas sp. TaxID=2023866 RepID=UPI000F0CC37C|nr:Hypothetical protein PEIBARAKI_5819 [Petrimonas sp. IBARAKI]